ncbi:calcium/sodium antiporter [Candidatus Nomurabacteria bacterium]|nr:calcium/sodium antiporter [Candidatus Nomurabacteria bacterium]USN94621.1 MAG: calcium/sodium antiporter [Candidatus Nomurabacteria bacterium]
MLTYILFVVGFIILIKGANTLVDGATSIARKLGVTEIVIGLTIVAFGTSAPELAVNVISALKGSTSLAVGNVLGSNIANIFLILGVAAAIKPLTVKRNTIFKEIPFSLLAALVVLFLALDGIFNSSYPSMLIRGDGLTLLGFFAIFLYYTVSIAKGGEDETEEDSGTPNIKPVRAIFMIVVGLVMLTLGGQWIVNGAIKIAGLLGMSESLIGLTVVAIGTSLPELATSIVAIRKGKTDIAIGNAVGSNIFNIFWILGVTSVIVPLPFSLTDISYVFMTVAASVFLFAALFVGRKHTLKRWQGFSFIFIYIMYLVYLIVLS